MLKDSPLSATGVFQGIGKDGQAVGGARLINLPGQSEDVGCSTAGVKGDVAERVADEVAPQVGVGRPGVGAVDRVGRQPGELLRQTGGPFGELAGLTTASTAAPKMSPAVAMTSETPAKWRCQAAGRSAPRSRRWYVTPAITPPSFIDPWEYLKATSAG
jgi:hypothetical protein